MGAFRSQEIAADALKLEPQGLGSHPEWELGTTLWALAETVFLTVEQSPQPFSLLTVSLIHKSF